MQNIDAQEVLQLAAKMKKPTKPRAHDALVKLLEHEPDQNTPDHLATLYAFFLPQIKKAKTPDQWLALAMGKKDVRYYLNYIYSDGERLIATDGHRIHVKPSTDYAPGYYDQSLNRVHDTDFARFPDIGQVVPKAQWEGATDARDLQNNDLIELGKRGHAYRISDKHGLNRQYLDQALETLSRPVAHPHDEGAPLLITDLDSDRYAVVMPVRL